ncbi:MAG: EscU/YscU/HrcU family type III secretion system export apparatus switch protein, partial [Pseudomonadota bacterium]
MNQGEEDSDKQYEPSQKKLEDARKKGEIAKSADLNTAASYAGMLLVLVAFAPAALGGLGTVMAVMLGQADDLAEVIFAGPGAPLHGGMLTSVFWGVLPWFALPAAFALLSVIAQRSLLFTGSKIAPKLNRISPIAGVKNKFGRQGLFEFVKSSAKLIIYCVVMAVFMISQIDVIIGSMQLTPRLVVVELGRMIVFLTGYVLLVALALGGVDYLWQSAEHIRKNRMSRKEMMEELKQAEGDPLMKQQRRARGQEIATNRMLRDV